MATPWTPPDIHAPYGNPPVEVSRQAPANPDAVNLDAMPPIFNVPRQVRLQVAEILNNADQWVIHNATAQKLERTIPSDAEKKAFFDKMYATINDKGAVFRKALENHTVQIFEVPWEDLYGVSMDGKNLDYLYKKNGEFFFGFYKRRIDERHWAFLAALDEHGLTEKLSATGEYMLYKKEGNVQIRTFSPEYFNGIMLAAKDTIETDAFIKWLQKKD